MNLTKVLVANRGEIALRVTRTLRRMGVRSVAVFSEADAQSLHTRLADESVLLGGAPSSESYLNGERVIDAALRTGAQAIHPGYGFLSEQAKFARKVEDAGLIFVGPTPDNIRTLGDKVAAREALTEAGIPPVPGSHAAITDFKSLLPLADSVGFPVIMKATAGGGGKGIRVIRNVDELESAWNGARGEALSAFGSSEMILERYLERARHVEVQVLGDGHGGVRVFYERDCSTQRRLQKVLEETPSPAVSARLREKLLSTSATAMSKTRYRGAGTLEFLMTESEELFFLEMNTRLQVEHPITEATAGVDLVQEQVEIAAGKRLSKWAGSLENAVTQPRGAAVEFRVNAEDPSNSWMPATGIVNALRWPAGPGIRVDSALALGDEVTAHYDSLLAKIIAHGPDRDIAFARLRVALSETVLGGVINNLPLGCALCSDDALLSAQNHCQYLEQRMGDRSFFPGEVLEAELPLAVAAAAWLRRQQIRAAVGTNKQPSQGWGSRSQKSWRSRTDRAERYEVEGS